MEQTQEQGYNGWSNYETWAVKLWLDNDEAGHYCTRLLKESAKENAPSHPAVKVRGTWELKDAERYILADALKGHVEENNPLNNDASMFTDLLNAALSEVDWNEIAENILSED